MHVVVYNSSCAGVEALEEVSLDAVALSVAELASVEEEDELEDGFTGLGAFGARLLINRKT